MKIYIKAFQLASDLDDTVEDKLLIGDRPKPSYDPETKLPLKDRLAARKQEEIDEVYFLSIGSSVPAHQSLRAIADKG